MRYVRHETTLRRRIARSFFFYSSFTHRGFTRVTVVKTELALVTPTKNRRVALATRPIPRDDDKSTIGKSSQLELIIFFFFFFYNNFGVPGHEDTPPPRTTARSTLAGRTPPSSKRRYHCRGPLAPSLLPLPSFFPHLSINGRAKSTR